MILDANTILLVQATVVVLLPFLLWHGCGLRQFFPLTVVQIISGLLLGPSIFGGASSVLLDAGSWSAGRDLHALSGAFTAAASTIGDLYRALFSNSGGIDTMATIAVSMFAFVAGADVDREKMKVSAGSIFGIGLGGLLVTWGIGSALGWVLATSLPSAVGKANSVILFAIVFGMCNAIPALPVLAALLREIGLIRERIGVVGLAAATIGDVTLWISLAIVLPFTPGAGAGGAGTGLLLAFLCISASLLGCLFIAGPLFNRLLARKAPERVIMSLVAVVVFLSAAITEFGHLHAVLGAFIAGVFLPDPVREMAAEKLDMPTALFLLPFFFLSTGLKTEFSLDNSVVWIVFIAGLGVCIFAKIASTMVAARLCSENWAFGLTVGVLLQTKGLMELVVARIFYDKMVISQASFSAVVMVALVSTALTIPVTSLLLVIFGEKLIPRKTPAGAAEAAAIDIALGEQPGIVPAAPPV
jgi:Kef-type K+ transport system membrane component KefB